jgi:3D (Asp-Asp-Asp) domain-containing protein
MKKWYILILSLILNLVLGFYLYKEKQENKTLRQHILNLVEGVSNIQSKISAISNRIKVDVTAYTAKETALFANGMPVAAAISPALEQQNIRLGDTVVLFDKNNQDKFLCQIVDRTSQDEKRAVVDLLFRTKKEAVEFGRRSFTIGKIKQNPKDPNFVLVTMDKDTWLYSKSMMERSMRDGSIKVNEFPKASKVWSSLNKPIGYTK